MTGSPLGVPAPPSSHSRLRPPEQSRTRRSHGFITIAGATAAVHSSRRSDKPLAVSVTVGTEALQLVGSMTPTQARSMARALVSAADAVERGAA